MKNGQQVATNLLDITAHRTRQIRNVRRKIARKFCRISFLNMKIIFCITDRTNEPYNGKLTIRLYIYLYEQKRI